MHKGGNHSRFEPSNVREINGSPFSQRCFRNVGSMKFCEKVAKGCSHVLLTSLFAQNFNIDKGVRVGP